MTLALSLLSVSVAWAQSDENQTPAPDSGAGLWAGKSCAARERESAHFRD